MMTTPPRHRHHGHGHAGPAATPFSLGIYQVVALLFLTSIAISVLMFGTRLLSQQQTSTPFMGEHWHHPGQTIEAVELLSAKYGRVEAHTIRTSRGDIVNGWLWIDFYDVVNVVVQDSSGNFPVFRQTNYGLPDKSLALVSGHVHPGEEPPHVARQEMLRELGYESRSWVFLGKFRSDANRGGGYVHCFLALNASPVDESQRAAPNDLEQKELNTLTKDELARSLVRGDFKDVKWTACVSLALLRID